MLSRYRETKKMLRAQLCLFVSKGIFTVCLFLNWDGGGGCSSLPPTHIIIRPTTTQYGIWSMLVRFDLSYPGGVMPPPPFPTHSPFFRFLTFPPSPMSPTSTTSSTSPESPVWRNQGATFVLSASTVGGPTSPLASLLVTTICSWPIKFREMRWLIGDAPQWSWCAAGSLCDSYALQDHCVILMRCRIIVWFWCAAGSLCDSCALQDYCVILVRCRIIEWFLCAAGSLCDSYALQDHCLILMRCRIIVWFLCAAGLLFDSDELPDHCAIPMHCRIIVWFSCAAGPCVIM